MSCIRYPGGLLLDKHVGFVGNRNVAEGLDVVDYVVELSRNTPSPLDKVNNEEVITFEMEKLYVEFVRLLKYLCERA